MGVRTASTTTALLMASLLSECRVILAGLPLFPQTMTPSLLCQLSATSARGASRAATPASAAVGVARRCLAEDRMSACRPLLWRQRHPVDAWVL